MAFVGTLPLLLTPELKARYLTILESGNADEAAATASECKCKIRTSVHREARRDLLMHALQLSAQHPLFGVGYNEFPVADSNRAAAEGQDAYWHEVHNIFAVILVENGFPALILFCCSFMCAGQGSSAQLQADSPGSHSKGTRSFFPVPADGAGRLFHL